MCTPWSHIHLSHLCTMCSLGWLQCWKQCWKALVMNFYTPSYKVYRMDNIIAYNCANIYNFQQRISWLSHRWRTQRNVISNVNCRIQWIIESLNAPCAPWYSEEHACLSVMKFSTAFLAFMLRVKLDLEDNCWRNLGCLLAPLKWMSFSNGS